MCYVNGTDLKFIRIGIAAVDVAVAVSHFYISRKLALIKMY